MLFTASIFLFKNNKAQNLIQNGSFENFTGINCSGNFVVNNWNNISSPDYYHISCSSANYGVPLNQFGISYPISENAYIGIASYYKTAEVKEYIYQHINNPLIANKSYYSSFYISRADRVGYSIKNIGANFSVIQPTVASSNTWIPANPQVVNNISILSDTTGWTKIEGYFTAQGGEQYMTIGNFNSNANTDTLYSGTTNPIPFDNGMSYYYIDSVSLYDSLDYVTNIKNHENDFKLNIYPNPNNGNFTLKYNLAQYPNAELLIYDVTGKVLSKTNLINTVNQLDMNVSKFESGIYYYTIKTSDEILITNKFVIIK